MSNDYPKKVVEEKQALLIKNVYICQLDFDCITEKEFIGEPSNNIYSNRTKKFSTVHMDGTMWRMGEQKLFVYHKNKGAIK
jgi:hypothetical protein